MLDGEADRLVDARGQACPDPVLNTKRGLIDQLRAKGYRSLFQ